MKKKITVDIHHGKCVGEKILTVFTYILLVYRVLVCVGVFQAINETNTMLAKLNLPQTDASISGLALTAVIEFVFLRVIAYTVGKVHYIFEAVSEMQKGASAEVEDDEEEEQDRGYDEEHPLSNDEIEKILECENKN